MPQGQAFYVEGQQHAFPHGKRLVSGPFDLSADAHTERKRIAPLYPDANLSVVTYRGKSLPQRKPRTALLCDLAPRLARSGPEYDLSRVEGRRAAASDLAAYARLFGAEVTVEDWDGEPDVDIRVPGGLATIWLGWTPAAPMPLISWVAAEGRRLRQYVPGAWGMLTDFAPAHRKATSHPADWAELFAMLEAGLCAMVDGTAFERE